jgi:hypothetical protein
MSRIPRNRAKILDEQEWNELVHLKSEITVNPTALDADAMELFTELLVRSLQGKGDPPFEGQFTK